MIIFSNEASFRGYEFNYSRPRLSPTNRSGSLSSVSTKKREFFPRGKRKERKNLVFRKWKEATTVRFFDQHLFDPRTSEADTCLWHPSSDDFVKSSRKVIQSCSGTGLCRRADINDLAPGNVFVKKLSRIVSSILFLPFSIRHSEGKSFDYPVLDLRILTCFHSSSKFP